MARVLLNQHHDRFEVHKGEIMKAKKIVQGMLAAGLAMPAMAFALDLTGIVYVQYGDALSYSLPVANLQKYGNVPKPGDEFYVASSPGAISDFIIVATGTGGKPMTENVNNSDNSYETPNGVNEKTSDSYFNPTNTGGKGNDGNYRDTLGTVTPNYDNTWDISLAALKSFLNGGDMLFFMNNNNVNSGTDSSLQSLAAWARIWLTDASGNVVGRTVDQAGALTFEGYYYLSNMGGQYATVSQGGGVISSVIRLCLQVLA